MFDTTALARLINALNSKNGTYPQRISTTASNIASNASLKGLVKDVAKTASAFGIDLAQAKYTFNTGVDKATGAIRIYQPSVGNLGGVPVISWGSITVPLSEVVQGRDLTITKEENGFALQASAVEDGKAISGKLKLKIARGNKVSLSELQGLLGDDETPMQLDVVLDNVIIDLVPSVALAKYKGQTLNVTKWVCTGSGDFGKRGYIQTAETGDARIQCPSKVRDEIPKTNFEVPDLKEFEQGEFLLRIGGSAKNSSSGQQYLQCYPVYTGVDLSGFEADDTDADAYGLPDAESALDDDLDGFGMDEELALV